MTGEQIIQIAGVLASAVLGGGGLAAILGVIVTRKLGIKTGENEANRDLNHTWDAIVENLQGQINALVAEVGELRKDQGELTSQLSLKERLLLRAILHIGKLELLVPVNKRISRPEGLE